jgi:hypothetical protein
MKTPDKTFDQVKTRGDFRALSERAQSATHDDSKNRISTDHPIWEVWDAIRSAWPGPTANWPDEPQPAWVFAIKDLGPEQLQAGVERMVTEGTEFPPSAPVFRSLCLTAANWEHRRQSAPPGTALPRPLANPLRGEMALQRIAQLRSEHGL